MSLSNLELDAFYAIHQEGTVLGASQNLGLTQTAVTQRLKSLERGLQTTLFLRTKRGMRLTDAGQKLLGYCLARRDLEAQALSQIKNEGFHGPVRARFSASTFFTLSQLLPLVRPLIEAFPAVRFTFNVHDEQNKLLLLKQDRADFVLLPRSEVALELDSKLLRPRRYVLVGDKAAAKAKKDFTILDFSPNDPFTDEFFARLGIERGKSEERHYVNNTLMFPALLEAGMGVAVLDEAHFKEARKSFDIHNIFPKLHYEIEWALAWMPRPQMPPYYQKIVDMLR